jgi:hypothetical protein
MRTKEVFEILRARSRAQTLSLHHCASVVCTAGLEQVWERLVCGQILGFSCTAANSRGVLAVGVLRAFEVGMLKMIRRVSQDLQDVS